MFRHIWIQFGAYVWPLHFFKSAPIRDQNNLYKNEYLSDHNKGDLVLNLFLRDQNKPSFVMIGLILSYFLNIFEQLSLQAKNHKTDHPMKNNQSIRLFLSNITMISHD